MLWVKPKIGQRERFPITVFIDSDSATLNSATRVFADSVTPASARGDYTGRHMFDAGALRVFAFGVVAAVVIIGLLVDWFRKQRIKGGLADRQSFDDEEFQRTFYAGQNRLSATATRIRKVLAKNLDMSLDAVRPEDRLDDDLGAQIAANPFLLAELEEEFGIATGYEELDVFEDTARQLVTFSDLVEYVSRKIDQSATEVHGQEKKDSLPGRIYDILADVVPPACLAGLAIAVVGSLFGIDPAFRIGSGIFMLGFVLLIISFFAIGIDNMTMEIQEQGLAWIEEHPLRTAWIGFIVSAMLYFSFSMLRWLLPIFTNSS